jgi:hypothetical protein
MLNSITNPVLIVISANGDLLGSNLDIDLSANLKHSDIFLHKLREALKVCEVTGHIINMVFDILERIGVPILVAVRVEDNVGLLGTFAVLHRGISMAVFLRK